MGKWWPCATCSVFKWNDCYQQVWHGDERDTLFGSSYAFKAGKGACAALIEWEEKEKNTKKGAWTN